MRELSSCPTRLLCACACSLYKNKKNKLLQNCNIVHASVVKCVVSHGACCVFLRESVVKCVAVHLVCCVFLLVS